MRGGLRVSSGPALGVVAFDHVGLEPDSLDAQPIVEREKLGVQGSSSLRAKTLAAATGVPKPPLFVGTSPRSCGGTRCAASTSSRPTFLMLKKSSRTATSLMGMICRPPSAVL